MTREEAIANHRKMWRWIADETERRKCEVDKSAYFNAMGITGKDIPWAQCYCCEYVNDKCKDTYDCALCPIEWPGGSCCQGGLSYQWLHAYGNWRESAALARRIAELPERDEELNDEAD